MDASRFDRLTRALGSGLSRRAALKTAFGLSATAAIGTWSAHDTDATRRPTPTPKPKTCPSGQQWDGSTCVCIAGTKCGSDCCTGADVCCDNACCNGACSSEEVCCPTGTIPCEKKCCGTGTRCDRGACFDDPCRTIGEPCAVNGDCCGVDAYAFCACSEGCSQGICTKAF